MTITVKYPSTIATLLLAAIIPAAAQILPSPATQENAKKEEIAALRDFQERVRDYVALHRLLEASLPQMRSTTDMTEVRANTVDLAGRLRGARPNAQPGDLFTPAVGPVFRQRIAACLPPERWAGILAEHAVDEDGNRVLIPMVRVNTPWPPRVPFNFVPPQLLRALPPLPPELQYRIIGRSLVLWDHHADLIVDFLPGAFST